jgi:hypothetical protein
VQFAPIAVTLSAASAAAAARGSSPPRVRPSSPKVSWAMTGRSHSASATDRDLLAQDRLAIRVRDPRCGGAHHRPDAARDQRS